MSLVANNNRGFLQLLADYPVHQRQLLLNTATPQQLHALIQVLYYILMGHISISEENKRLLQLYKDALLDLTKPDVIVQEGSGLLKNYWPPVVSSLGFLHFAIKEVTHRKVDHSKLRLPPVLII